MKLKKLFALALAVCMMALAVPAAFAAGLTLDSGSTSSVTSTPVLYNSTGNVDSGVSATSVIEDNGLSMSKSVTKIDGTVNDFNVHLQVSTDGVSGVNTTPIPADIVLVLEESSWMSTTMYAFREVDAGELDTSERNGGPYYIKYNDSYIRVRWCTGGLFNTHDDGWYSGVHFFIHWGFRFTPLAGDATDNGTNRVQFYERYEDQDYTNKLEAVRVAATSFVQSVVTDARTNDVDHRVSIVSYSTSADTDVGLEADIRENNGDVYDAIEALTAADTAGSDLALGLAEAQDAFSEAATTTGTRNKVVVVYCYGVAGDDYNTDSEGNITPTWSTDAVNSANSAIAAAKSLKEAGITIYTVGLGDNIDPTLDITDTDRTTDDSYRTNAYLHYVSSNFPYATSITTGGEGDINNGKYLSALDISSLNNIFEKLTEEFETPTISLDGNTQIRDYVTEYFTIDQSSVSVYSVDNGGNRVSLSGMTVTPTANSVTVSGFDFNKHFIGGSDPETLNIEFTIRPKEGFLGGNGVPTNVYATSGVFGYSNETGYALVENFGACTADVAIPDVDFTAKTETIYLSNAVSTELYNSYVVEEDWMGEYVSISYSDATSVSNVDCGTYEVKMTIAPTETDGSVSAREFTATAAVHVVKPVVSNADAVIYAGNTIDLTSCMIEGTDWVCEHTGDAQKSLPVYTVEGETKKRNAPLLTHTFNGESTSTVNLKACTPYTVETSVGGNVVKPVNDDATFTVHVLQPNLDGTDVTIWQGNSTTLAAITDWKCTCAETAKTPADVTAGLATLNATTPVFTEKGKTDAVTTVSPADCTQYTVAFTANNIPYTNDFWVHVRTVSFTMNPKTIYLSEVVDVAAANKQVKSVVWQETACDCKDMTPPEVSGSKGATSVVFDKEGETAYIQPGNCTTPDVYLKIGDKISNVKAPFTVHVLKPTVKTSDVTIFLGQDAVLSGSVDSWACDINVCKDVQRGRANTDIEDDITWEFVKVDDNKVTTDKVTDEKLTKCTPTVAVGTLYGQKFTSKTVMVHVVLPTVTGTEATIKMGNPAPLAATTEWGNDKCEGGHVKAPAQKPNFTLGSKFYDTDGKTVVTNYGVLDGNPSYPSSCHTYIAAAIVNGVEYTFDGNRDNFMIHVQTPVVTGTDTAIYLGNDTTLAAEITDWNVCKPAEGEEIGTHGQSLTNSNEANPEHSFIYTDKETNTQVTTVSPVTCKPYTVGLKTIGGVILEGTEYQDEFTVHVYVPQFTVTTQDLWADCGSEVPLYVDKSETDAIVQITVSNEWVDRSADGSTLTTDGDKAVVITGISFDKNDPIKSLGETDVNVKVIKLSSTVNGATYEVTPGTDVKTDANLTVTKAVSGEDHDFTVHVNRFNAIIQNNGSQNAIYTLSGGTLKSNIQIAVPAGGNVTVSGLLCGKDEKGNSLTYTVTEEEGENNDWTWRYSVPAGKQTISKSIDGVNIKDSNSKVDVPMTYKSVTNAKWLADEDCVVNKATTQATITNPALSVKKKDEEVTNV